MPKKVDESAELAAAMIQALEASKARHDGSYPPTLRDLAEMPVTSPSPTPEQILKAVGKKTFSALAVVPEKVNRKPSLDSPVYVKEDAPAKKKPAPKRAPKPKDDGSELARKLLLLLDHQREHDPRAYPPTLRRLAELCGLSGSEASVTKAVGHKTFTETAIVAAKVGTKPALDVPVLLKKDEHGSPTVLRALLTFALQPIEPKGKVKASAAFDLAELPKKLVEPLRASFRKAVEQGLEAKTLPPGVGSVPIKGKAFFFLMESVQSGAGAGGAVAALVAPAPGSNHQPVAVQRDFAAAFRQAFDQLDRRNGATNFVTLADLRRILAEFGRHEFDAGLNALRIGGEFSLDSHEGLHGTLSPEERDAGVREAGSLLVYASRR